jgi:hypothetical protein
LRAPRINIRTIRIAITVEAFEAIAAIGRDPDLTLWP